jgi:F420 biosynthesis protein FbiB-like protein
VDFIALARSRRSLRVYTPQPVPPELLERILEAAHWAPSAHNRQPWRFAVLTSPSQREALALTMGARLRHDLSQDGLDPALIEKDVSRSYSRITSAPVLICLCLSMKDMDTYPDERRNGHERTMAVQSVAMAGQNLLLAAHALGLAACWMCAPLFCPDVVSQTLALPPDWEAQALISLGYPAQERQRERRPIQEFILWR